jgi:hypothetical protein
VSNLSEAVKSKALSLNPKKACPLGSKIDPVPLRLNVLDSALRAPIEKKHAIILRIIFLTESPNLHRLKTVPNFACFVFINETLTQHVGVVKRKLHAFVKFV